MNSRFNIITTVAYRIQCILKAVFEFMFSQMTKSKSIRVVYLIPIGLWQSKKQIRRRPYEFQHVTFENILAIASLNDH